MNKTTLALIAAAAMLAGCASTNDIVPVGKDTYMVSGWGKSPGGYSGAEVKAAAIRDANKFCEAKGKHVQVLSSTQRDMTFGKNATAELQFMCLDSSDAQFARSASRKEGDLINVRKDEVAKEREPHSSLYEELLKLDDLRKKGIITDAEFAQQKAKLLAK